MANSDASGADYQVFLSFRGPDTRQGFTDCLYHFLVDAGVRVFRDNEEIRPGDKIEVILTAIKNSTVCIPIFSKDFASSTWCLRELSEMVKLKKIILPVFFDVTAADVKLETPLYRNALREHGDGTGKEEREMALEHVLEVSGWKSNDQGQLALKEVVKIKGWALKDKGHGELCKTIVAEVLTNLKVRDRIVSDRLVGIEDQVESVRKLLDMNAPGVRYVLIHGIGGIGKTTLAKTVFNRLHSCFDHYSFLSDVRELSERHGVKYLQKQLLADTCRISTDISSSDEGIRAIRDMLSNKKVLIVLDDVDKREQIKNLIPSPGSLESGSRIIVATRDERVLDFGQEINYAREVSTLKMEELDSNQALELFSVHAFDLTYPPSEYLDLSKQVVSLAGHLPLYLEVAASYLSRKNREAWNIYITQLGNIPEKKVEEKLMISYDALDIRTKQIFLDIACFFVNKDKRDATYMWEACGFHPDIGLEELTSKSLVKVIDGNKLWMHDFLRDLGREIVCRENLVDPGEHSRLWIHEEALGILERKEGTRKVQALSLSSSDDDPPKCFTRKNFKKLINLRFLEWSGLKLEGNFEHLLSKLRWLSWHHCPQNFVAEMLNLANLVFLDLTGSDISQDWEGWSQTNMGRNLKVLNLTNCVKITKTPDLSRFTGLEKLIFSGCTQLTEIDCSICIATRLKHLDLTDCVKLTKTPDLSKLTGLEKLIFSGCTQLTEIDCSICMATRLKHLNLTDCEKLTKTPDLSKLTGLERLIFSGCTQLTEIDRSIRMVKRLKHLDLSDCRSLQGLPEELCCLDALEELFMAGGGEAHSFSLPEFTGDLVSLTVLELRRVKVTALPESICKLKRLTRLVLNACWGIKKFPDSFGDLESLVTLDAGGCKDLCELPDSIGSLKQLKVINLEGTQISKLPRTIGKLEQLEELIANRAGELAGDILPEIDGLSRLRYLDLSFTAITALPSLSKLSHLKTLHLLYCNKLLQVPELPVSLTELEVRSQSVLKISSDFSMLNGLIDLDWSCPKVGWPWGKTSCALTHLSSLILGDLDFSKKFIPRLSTLENLSSLRLVKCKFGERFQCLGLGDMRSLKILDMSDCDFDKLNRDCVPENLETLAVCRCRLLTLLDVSHLRNLKDLSISSCNQLKVITGIAELKSKPSSNTCISGCPFLPSLDYGS